MRKSEGGFTIVEILVIVVVIGIITSIGIMSVNGMNVQYRDSIRRTNAEMMALKVEQYYKYKATSRGHEYPSDTYLTSHISDIFGDESLLEDPSRSGNRLETCQASGISPGYGVYGGSFVGSNIDAKVRDFKYMYCAQNHLKHSCETTYGTTATDPCVSFSLFYYRESDNSVQRITSIWRR